MPVDKKDPALEDDALDPLEAARESGAAAIRVPRERSLEELLADEGKEPAPLVPNEDPLDLPAGERGVVHAQVHEILFEPAPRLLEPDMPENDALKVISGMGLFDGVSEEDLKVLAAEASFEIVEPGQKIADMEGNEHALYISTQTALASIGNRRARLEAGKPYGIYVFVGVEKPTVDITLEERAIFIKIPAAAFMGLSPEAQDRVMTSVLGNSHLSMMNRELSRESRVLVFNEYEPEPEEMALIKSPDVSIGMEEYEPGQNIKHKGEKTIGFIVEGGVDVRAPIGVGAHQKVAELNRGNFVGERQAAGFNRSATMIASGQGAKIIWCRLTREMLKIATKHQAAKVRTANDALLSQ